MPSRKIHNLINRLILGKSYDDINRFIDLPYLWLGGRHRKYFHDLKTTPALIALIKKDLRAGLAAVLHILADRTFKNKK
jgi:hypothetical protein